jgi:hypothetical protein
MAVRAMELFKLQELENKKKLLTFRARHSKGYPNKKLNRDFHSEEFTWKILRVEQDLAG